MNQRAKKQLNVPLDWWKPEKQFFGTCYMRGDNSREGYLPGRVEDLWQRTEREALGVMRLLELKPQSKLLDVPTGYGRHAIFLSQNGQLVTGIDINDVELEAARASAERVGVAPVFIKADMRAIPEKLYEKFDAVINMFYSFGFFASEEENVQVMREFYKALRPDGKLLIHTDVSPEMIEEGSYRFEDSRGLKNGGTLLIEEQYNPQTKRMEGAWIIDAEVRQYSVRIYSAEEFVEMAKACGFREVRVYGSFEGEPFTPDSKEMIVVARK